MAMIILHQILFGTSKGVTNMTNVSMDDINKLVSLQLGVRDVTAGAFLVEDLGAESADVVNIIAILEEKYKIAVRESEIAKIQTPADMLKLVKRHLSLRGQ
jgi:acyl carrier protein